LPIRIAFGNDPDETPAGFRRDRLQQAYSSPTMMDAASVNRKIYPTSSVEGPYSLRPSL
jgi:hypothetical protein